MKKTAIEWFTNQLEKHYVFQDIRNTTAFLHAKEMEKEQIMDAYDSGWSDGFDDKDLNAEYYFETFKTNEK
jgi:hypothetical protein